MSDLIPWLAPWSGRVLVGVLALAGVALIIWSWRTQRGTNRRRCPKCWYDMQATPGMRCAECGHEAKRERDLMRSRARRRGAFAGFMLCALAGGLALANYGYQHKWHYAVLPKFVVMNTESREGITIEWLETRDPDAPDWGRKLRIIDRGRTVFELSGFYCSAQWWPNTLPPNAEPRDASWLIITNESGGTGCIASQHVFGFVHGAFEPIDMIPYCGMFRDIDGDGTPEFEARDRTFAYWETDGAHSPYPRVIMRLTADGFVPAIDLIRTPTPTHAELESRLASSQFKGDRWHDRFAAVLHVTLDLIYTGHEAEAWAFLHEHWPHDPNALQEVEFTAALKTRLRESPFWPTVFALNHDGDESTAIAGATD